MSEINEPELFDILREQGIPADDAAVRAAVRAVLAQAEEIEDRDGVHTARACMEAMRAALSYRLQRPKIGDMSDFEEDFHDEA